MASQPAASSGEVKKCTWLQKEGRIDVIRSSRVSATPGTPFAPAAGFCLLLENLTSVEQLPPTGATVVIGALKLQRAQGSPARVLALIP